MYGTFPAISISILISVPFSAIYTCLIHRHTANLTCRLLARCSSGNHGAALALAAKLRGITAHVVVPKNTPAPKCNAIRAYGANLVFCAPTMDAREAECARIQAATGATLVPPYNHPHVMAGQGTLALELLAQVRLAGGDAERMLRTPMQGRHGRV